MNRFRKSLRAIRYFAILLMCGEAANAAPILLQEFTHMGFAFRTGPTPATVPFRFSASSGPPTYFFWVGDYGPSDIGMTFTAPPDVLAGANEAIHSPTVGYHSGIAEISFQSWAVPPFPYFPNHTLTSLERIIDRLEITGFQNVNYTVQATQRIQFWGVPIPEPTTILPLSVVFCCIGLNRRIACGHHRPKSHSHHHLIRAADLRLL